MRKIILLFLILSSCAEEKKEIIQQKQEKNSSLEIAKTPTESIKVEKQSQPSITENNSVISIVEDSEELLKKSQDNLKPKYSVPDSEVNTQNAYKVEIENPNVEIKDSQPMGL